MDKGMVLPELLEGLGLDPGAEEGRRWAVRCAHALGLEGIAVHMQPGEELVWFSDDTSARLADAQFTLGQGPGLDEDEAEVPLQVADVRTSADHRWQQFAAEAEILGVRAVFVWPLRSGAARLGTLTGYRSTPGTLTTQQAQDGLAMADVLAGRLLSWHPGSTAPGDGPGTAGVLELHRAEVHQATGVLSYQLGVPMDEALAHLRARAFAAGQPLTDVARALLSQLPST